MTEAVPHLVRAAAARRPRLRRPEDAALLVAHVERFAVRIDDRVVAPRRQPMLPAVAAPGAAGAAFAHQAAEALVGEHVAPWHGRPLAARRRHVDHVLAAAGREAAEAVRQEPLRDTTAATRALRR